MATLIKEGMTGAQVASVIEQNFENLEKEFQQLSDLFDHTTKDLERTLDSYLDILDKIHKQVSITTDNEDTISVDNKIKFNDRIYDSNENIRGFKILRKNIVCNTDTGISNNILVQDVFTANTIYEVRYNFDLNGATITLPKGVILDFKGGNFINGILQCDNTIIIAPSKDLNSDTTSLFNDCLILGTYTYFGENGGGSGIATNIIDNLNSSSATDALSANQGRILNEKIQTVDGNLSSITLTTNQHTLSITNLLQEDITIKQSITNIEQSIEQINAAKLIRLTLQLYDELELKEADVLYIIIG